MDLDWLFEAYQQTRTTGAAVVENATATEYEQDLERNLHRLLACTKSGSYCAPPVRRALIPQGSAEVRPIGIPTLEDKILQLAVVMLLDPICEQDFLECSYGFRRQRSAHQALGADDGHRRRLDFGGRPYPQVFRSGLTDASASLS